MSWLPESLKERIKLANKKLPTKSHSFSFQILLLLCCSSVLPLYMRHVRKQVYNKESNRRKERKRREGTFLLQLFDFYSDNPKDSLLEIDEFHIDIERWSESHEQQYTSEKRKRLEEKLYRYEKERESKL
jgi:biopolymer transport protein ExbB/TolQ